MARCRCEEVECSCRLTNGQNVTITGDGTSATPWIISATPTSEDTFGVADTGSLDLILSGQGSLLSPYVVSGNVNIDPVLQLADTATIALHKTGAGNEVSPMVLTADAVFVDLSVAGNPGDVLNLRADGKYVPGPVGVTPGTVYATGGVGGNGTFGDPLHIAPTLFPDMAALTASTLPNGSLASVTALGVFVKGTDGVWRATDSPAGTIRETINTAADVGWAMMDGQTLVDAQTKFPQLWAMAPASWKAAANLTLPNMASRVGMGAGLTALGLIGGANQVSIAAAQLPAHSHSIDHDHPAVATSFVSNDHQHDYSGTTGAMNSNASHYHTANIFIGGPATNTLQQAGAGVIGLSTVPQVTDPTNTDHTHNFSGRTGGITQNHNHTVDLPYFSGSSGSVGGGQPLSLAQAHLAVNFQIRTY